MIFPPAGLSSNLLGMHAIKPHRQPGAVVRLAAVKSKPCALQPIVPDHKSFSIPTQQLDHMSAAIGEGKAVSVQRILAKLMLTMPANRSKDRRISQG